MDKTIYDALAALRASGLQGTGTENGDSIDLGILGLVRAVVSVSVVESGASIAIKIQGSSDDSTFYDLPGGVFLDPSDGAAIDAVGEYEIYIKSALRYFRVVGVVATAAITWECYLTKAFK